jgi:hypothetical protein
MSSPPLHFWPSITTNALTATSIVCVALMRAVVIVVALLVGVACCYHIC